MEKSIFIQLFEAIGSHQGGTVRLRTIVEPMFDNEELVIQFYRDVETANSEDAETGWYDPIRSIQVFEGLASAYVDIPLPPGVGSDNPLALTKDGKHYLDPSAASASLKEMVSYKTVPENFASISVDPNEAANQLAAMNLNT